LRRRGGNLSLKMLKKHSRRWKNSLSEFQLGFQIRFLKMNWFTQSINQALAKPLITDDLGFKVLGGLGFRKRPAEITWRCCVVTFIKRICNNWWTLMGGKFVLFDNDFTINAKQSM
jgi:hypothetical protein